MSTDIESHEVVIPSDRLDILPDDIRIHFEQIAEESYATLQQVQGELDRVGCGSAWKRDPGSGVIGVEKGPLIPVV